MAARRNSRRHSAKSAGRQGQEHDQWPALRRPARPLLLLAYGFLDGPQACLADEIGTASTPLLARGLLQDQQALFDSESSSCCAVMDDIGRQSADACSYNSSWDALRILSEEVNCSYFLAHSPTLELRLLRAPARQLAPALSWRTHQFAEAAAAGSAAIGVATLLGSEGCNFNGGAQPRLFDRARLFLLKDLDTLTGSLCGEEWSMGSAIQVAKAPGGGKCEAPGRKGWWARLWRSAVAAAGLGCLLAAASCFLGPEWRRKLLLHAGSQKLVLAASRQAWLVPKALA